MTTSRLIKFKEQFDEQHHELGQLLRQVKEASGAHIKNIEKSRVMSKFLDYIRQHFRDEEAVMRELNYDNFNSHKQEHQELIESLSKYCFGNQLIQQTALSEVHHFIETWCKSHAVGEDAKFDQFLDCEISKELQAESTTSNS